MWINRDKVVKLAKGKRLEFDDGRYMWKRATFDLMEKHFHANYFDERDDLYVRSLMGTVAIEYDLQDDGTIKVSKHIKPLGSNGRINCRPIGILTIKED